MSSTLYSITGLLILDAEGKRLFTKYYNRSPDSLANKQYPTSKEQLQFETGLFKKTRQIKTKGVEIILYDGSIILYRLLNDVYIYLIGSVDENELLLDEVIKSFTDTLNSLSRGQTDKSFIVENIDCVAIAIDETIDDGIVLEVDSEKIVSRVSKRGPEMSDIQINEQTILQAYNNAKDRLTRSLLS